MKRIALLALLALGMQVAVAQTISVPSETHDFGMIKEGEEAKHDFVLTNTGDKPLIISNVQASCGCTTPSWTKEPIMPGKSGKVSAVFNSAGRPGPVFKTITVASNASNPSMTLTLNGMVLKKDAAPENANSKAAISIPRVEIALGKLEVNRKQNVSVPVKNTGSEPLVVKEIQSGCNCAYILTPTTIAPGATADVKLEYTPRYKGGRVENIYLMSNDPKNAYAKVGLKVDVVESLVQSSPLKEGRAAVPFR